jgi:hypothetical protein
VSNLRSLLVSLGLLTLSAGAFALAAQSPASAHVQPIVECVFHDTGTGQYNALWGYNNPSASTVTLPIGGANNFAPNPADRGQGTTFSAGRHDNTFVVTWSGTGDLAWNLDTLNAHATTNSPACSSNPVPIATYQTLLWAALAVLLAGGAVLFLRRRGTRFSTAPVTELVGLSPRR